MDIDAAELVALQSIGIAKCFTLNPIRFEHLAR